VGRVTLQTVADEVGVSRMTVSNAFSRPDQLSAALRERILAVAADLGYVGPDPAARALVRGTSGAVGVLMTDSLTRAFDDEVATGFLGAVADHLTRTGLALTLLTSTGRGDLVPARDVPLDGALVYSCDLDSQAVEWLIRRGLPLVYVDQTPVPGIPSVNVDDRSGARSAAEHLVELGHRRIGILTAEKTAAHSTLVDAEAPSAHHVARERMLGWSDALDAAGIEPVVARGLLNPEESVRRSARLLLDLDEPPTAVLCWSDVLAFWVVREAEDRGLRVPEDLSVVGFDDNPLARRMRPELTTVRQDVAGKGETAARLLTTAIDRVRGGAVRKPARVRRELLPTELVVRASTAKSPR
jgi:DNA-binding LacI/PurR family transcriptional regulator